MLTVGFVHDMNSSEDVLAATGAKASDRLVIVNHVSASYFKLYSFFHYFSN